MLKFSRKLAEFLLYAANLDNSQKIVSYPKFCKNSARGLQYTVLTCH